MGEREGFQKNHQKRLQAQYNRGVALAKAGRMEETLEWFNKGIVLNDLGRSYEAIKCFDKVLKKIPSTKMHYTVRLTY